MRRSRQMAAFTICFTTCASLPAQRPIADHGLIENRGQFDPAIKYKLTSRTGAVSLTTTGIIFDGGRAVVTETFDASNPAIALEPVRGLAGVAYKDVWPGISVRLTSTGIGIEQEFIIAAGADPGNIAVTYTGIDSMTTDADGSLVIATARGTLREHMPQVYQEMGSHRIPLPGRYRLLGPATYGFQLDTYAPGCPLIIGLAQPAFSQSSDSATAAPVVNFFTVAPASTLPGQATIGTLSVSGATTATVNGISANCSNGECAGTILFDPASTTKYVLEASGVGGNVSASQTVKVGQYLPNPAPIPAGLQVTWQGACWLKGYPKSFCNGACQGMAFAVSIPAPPSELPLEATLYLGSRTCNPAQQDNLNDLGTLTGSGGWIFWFTNHPNRENSSAIWTIGNQSSGCVSYANAPDCQ